MTTPLKDMALVMMISLAACSPDDPIAVSTPASSTTTENTTVSEVDKFNSTLGCCINMEVPMSYNKQADFPPEPELRMEVLKDWGEPVKQVSLRATSVPWASVEAWRPEVVEAVTHFGGDSDDVDRFLRIMQCESGGDPLAKNPNSSASGLMQHLTRYWQERAELAGVPGADVFDGNSNIWVSAWLALAAPGGGWQHWVCR